MEAASLCLISPVRGSSLAASNLSMKHFILVPQRPSKSTKYFYAFYIFSSSIFFKFPYCSVSGFELEVKVHLGFTGPALECTMHSDGFFLWSSYQRHFPGLACSTVGGVSWQGFQKDLGIASPEFSLCPFWNWKVIPSGWAGQLMVWPRAGTAVGGVRLAGWPRCWGESDARGCCTQLRLPIQSQYPFFQVVISVSKFLIILSWLALL